MQFVDAVVEDLTDYVRDVPNKRFLHTKHGYDIVLERRDPYGFVYVVWHKGPTPEALSGAYQTFPLAKQDVINYMNNETFNKIVDEPVTIEPIVYKKQKRA